MYYESSYLIDERGVDHRGHCRLSALLGFLQENAAEAAASVGMSRQVMARRYHGFWMLARIQVELESPLRWGERLTLRTWHRPARGALSYRDFDLYRDGAPIGQVISVWVLADMDSHKLLRLDQVREYTAHSGPGLGKTAALRHLKVPEGLELVEERRLQYSEQDLNGHINNTRYADYACDALRLERLDERDVLRGFRAGFLAECRAGDRLSLWTGERGETRWVRATGQDGTARFEAALDIRRE